MCFRGARSGAANIIIRFAGVPRACGCKLAPSMPAQINITAEGRTCTVPAGFPLADFLKSCGLVPRQVRVVRNGLTLTPGEIATVTLENGDMLEIVKIGADG